jgi:hypothetical protein
MALKKAKNLVGFHAATDMPQKQKTANGFADSTTQVDVGCPHASIPNALTDDLQSTDLTAFRPIGFGAGQDRSQSFTCMGLAST